MNLALQAVDNFIGIHRTVIIYDSLYFGFAYSSAISAKNVIGEFMMTSFINGLFIFPFSNIAGDNSGGIIGYR